MSLRFALQESLNAVSIRITKAMGVPTVARYARKFGFDDTAIPNNLSIALGAGGIAPLDLVTGYATFANGGYRVDHYFIQRIANAAGEVVYETKPAFVCADCGQPPPAAAPDSCARPPAPPPSAKPEAASPDVDLTNLNAVAPQIITPQNAYLMTDLLKDVVRGGTAARANRAFPERKDLAGKTGTTNEGHDTWFVGFNSDVVAAAWVGFDQDRSLGGREQGGVTAIPMWIDYMREALANEPEHTLAAAGRHRRVPNQSDQRTDRERRHARHRVREVRHRQRAGARAGPGLRLAGLDDTVDYARARGRSAVRLTTMGNAGRGRPER